MTVDFPDEKQISAIAIYLDSRNDESYCPEIISIEVENPFFDLKVYDVYKFIEPFGWFLIKLEVLNEKNIEVVRWRCNKTVRKIDED